MTTEETLAPLFLNRDETLVFVDIETFGVNPLDDPPLEIGFRITDRQLKTLHEESWLIWDGEYYNERHDICKNAMEGTPDAFVFEMHQRSNLWSEAARDGDSITHTEEDILDWFSEINLPENLHLTGSSVHFDRYVLQFNLRRVADFFHYRLLDISSLKIMTQLFNPDLAEKAKALNPRKLHRALSDLQDSVEEFEVYLEALRKPSEPDVLYVESLLRGVRQ